MGRQSEEESLARLFNAFDQRVTGDFKWPWGYTAQQRQPDSSSPNNRQRIRFCLRNAQHATRIFKIDSIDTEPLFAWIKWSLRHC